MTSKDPLVARSVATDDDLAPRPIDPTWIVDGTPQARARALDFGEDRMISAMIWESTGGTFDWRYGSDEIIHVLAGEAELTMADGTIKPIKEGDTVFFPGHQIVRWHIPVYLKKVALQTPEISIPRQIAHRVPFAKRFVRKVRSLRTHAVAVAVGGLGLLGHLGELPLTV
jgi:uncharacterized cupin superfamily protein